MERAQRPRYFINMKKVLLQIGHKNIEKLTNQGLRSWRDVAYLRKSTGASGERDYFSKLVPMLSGILKNAGVEVTVVDGIYSAEVAKKYDLWASFHYDGGGEENRCMISSPLRNGGYLNDGAHNEADKFCEIWKNIYPTATATINRDNRITAGMLEYYGFDYVEMDTPAVIIEHFNHTSPRGAELKNNLELVAKADAQAILKYFGIEQEVPPVGFTLDTDIPSEVEKKYNLKNFARYVKYWTFGELINDWTLQAQELLSNSVKLEQNQKDIEDAIELRKQYKLLEEKVNGLNSKITTQKEQIGILQTQTLDKLTIGEVLILLFNSVKDLKIKR